MENSGRLILTIQKKKKCYSDEIAEIEYWDEKFPVKPTVSRWARVQSPQMHLVHDFHDTNIRRTIAPEECYQTVYVN